MDHDEELDHLRQRNRELEEEVISLKKQLEERKLVERAKSTVMRMLGIEEEDAYRRLRTYASSNNLKLADVARRIIDAEEPFRQLRAYDARDRSSS